MAIIQFFNTAACAEIVAFITAVFALPRRANTYWRLFIIYLFITILVEIIGFYYRFELQKPNYPFYNGYMIIQAAFFSFLFTRFNRTGWIKWLPALLLAAFTMFFIFEGISNSFSRYNGHSRQLLAIFTVLLSCLFYLSLLKDDNITKPLNYAPFWIVTGLFFYYFGSIPMFALYDKVSGIKLSGNISFYNLVMGSLSCILYGSWIIGFLWKKKQSRPFGLS